MNNPIMQHAVVTLLNMITSSMNFNDLYNTDIWIERLGGGFVTQNKLQKGLTILKSFESTLILISKNRFIFHGNIRKICLFYFNGYYVNSIILK